MAYTTRLGGSNASFDSMMRDGFGIVTVMNARIYDTPNAEELKNKTAYSIYSDYKNVHPICRLDTLKIANVTQEGPSKTVTGGQYSNPLIKFGKSARLEMQDALGDSKAIDALCGGIEESKVENGLITGLHFSEDFAGPKMIIGDSFFIDRKSGQQVPVIIMFYQFLPDSIFNLTQDAEGDATVFDMNGDLLTTVIQIGDSDNGSIEHGVFYSIINPDEKADTRAYFKVEGGTTQTPTLTLTAATGYTINDESKVEIAKDQALRVVIRDGEDTVVFDEVIRNY